MGVICEHFQGKSKQPSLPEGDHPKAGEGGLGPVDRLTHVAPSGHQPSHTLLPSRAHCARHGSQHDGTGCQEKKAFMYELIWQEDRRDSNQSPHPVLRAD